MATKGKKTIIILTGLAAAGTAIYFLFRKDQSKIGGFVRNVEKTIKGEEDIPDVVVETPVKTGSSYSYEAFPLKKGMGGNRVKAMQTILNELYLDKIGIKIAIDGKFGPDTEAALVKATGKKQLSEDDYYNLAKAAKAKTNVEEDEDITLFDIFDPFSLFH